MTADVLTPQERIAWIKAATQSVSLTSWTAWYPDAGLPSPCAIDFHVRFEAGALLWRGERAAVCSLGLTEYRELLRLAGEAISSGGASAGPDTAIDRKQTTLELCFVDHVSDRRTHATSHINHHYLEGRGPSAWTRLLERIAILSELRGADREHIDLLLRAFAR